MPYRAGQPRGCWWAAGCVKPRREDGGGVGEQLSASQTWPSATRESDTETWSEDAPPVPCSYPICLTVGFSQNLEETSRIFVNSRAVPVTPPWGHAVVGLRPTPSSKSSQVWNRDLPLLPLEPGSETGRNCRCLPFPLPPRPCPRHRDTESVSLAVPGEGGLAPPGARSPKDFVSVTHAVRDPVLKSPFSLGSLSTPGKSLSSDISRSGIKP